MNFSQPMPKAKPPEQEQDLSIGERMRQVQELRQQVRKLEAEALRGRLALMTTLPKIRWTAR